MCAGAVLGVCRLRHSAAVSPGGLPGELPGKLPEDLPEKLPGELPPEGFLVGFLKDSQRNPYLGVSRWGHLTRIS